MPRLDAGDRKLLIGAGALLLVLTLAAVLLSPPPADVRDAGFPSTYSASSGGAKAAYLLLKELGYDVQRWERSPRELPAEPAGYTLILALPVVPGDADEYQAIHRFVRAGGRLLAISARDPRPVPDAPDRSGGSIRGRLDWREFRPQAASSFVDNAPVVTMADEGHFWGTEHEFVPLYGDKDGAVVVTYRVGNGQVILWTATTPVTNAGIPLRGNLSLFLDSVGPAENTILWDEYFHGQQGSLWTYLAHTPVPWALLQAGLAAVAILLGFARRHGPMRAPEPESRLSPLEFVSTLGGLYQRARAASTAVGIAHQRFRHLLAKRLGVAANAPARRLHDGARDQLGWKQPGLLAFLQRCDRAQRDAQLSDHEALALVQGLAHYTELLRLGSAAGTNAPQQGNSSWNR